MYEYFSLLNRYRGQRIYANANPAVGDDLYPGTSDKPVLTLTEAIDRVVPESGDLIIANSSLLHFPPGGQYAFTENVILNKSITAIFGKFTINVTSGIGLNVHNTLAVEDNIGGCLVIGATVYGNGMAEGYRVRNSLQTIIADCYWFNTTTENQIGFNLTNEGGETGPFFGGNGFIDCRALGGNFTGTRGFKLQDEGSETNFVLDSLISKNDVGIEIVNSALQGKHVIVENRFDANGTPCTQADALHSYYLFANYYSDIPKGFDAAGLETLWPNDSATWTFAHPDELPIANIGAMFANKIMPLSNITMVRRQLLRNIQSGGFGVAPP